MINAACRHITENSIMRLLKYFRHWLRFFVLGLLLLPEMASAQVFFQYSGYGDLLLGFRKTGAHQGSYELVVNAGNVTNLIGLAPGAQVPVGNFTAAQLTDAFADGYGNLQWSAFSTFQLSSAWVTPVGTYSKATLWLTVPSPATNAQSAPFARNSFSLQSLIRQKILGCGSGANTYSTGLATTNADNNSVLVREPLNSPNAGTYNLTVWIGDNNNPTIGDFNGSFTVENTTPNTFTSPQRSDLYQAVPTTFADPQTGQTSGNAYFVGYFLLYPNGTMTFTRASAVQVPPPNPTLTISRSGNTSTISFGTTNGATYNLIYTNSAGLSAPRSAWPSLGSPLTGNGGTMSFMDTSTTPVRFYSVTAH